MNARKRREEEKEEKETDFFERKKKGSVLIRDFPEELDSSPWGRVRERTRSRHRGEETREDLNER